ncbi:MAG: dGTPase [Gammaproteobacteria bacterium]|nr:dGTPase [Gammaproteobacteria bacterium]
MIDFSIKFISSRPQHTKERENLQSLLFDYESDRGRIINSAAVRRLQQKTQVFPLERNSAVRSRLTHSLEVQQVGRFIVQSIFNQLDEEKQLEYKLEGLDRHIESIVEMSCLMHDIGNPPFGHFGEQAINDWFNKNLSNTILSMEESNLSLDESLNRDICNFEGNAQAVRLIHSLLRLNLTYSQVAGILKYTRCGTEVKPEKDAPLSYLKKKVGYYFSEKKYIGTLCDKLNMQVGHRHPASYIMEAADDISYCLADLEDAVEKGILDIKQLREVLLSEYKISLNQFKLDTDGSKLESALEKAVEAANNDDICQNSQFFIALRVGITHPLVKHAVKRFIDNISAVYQGSFNEALLEDNSHAHAVTEAFKSVAIKYVFCHKEVEGRELQGYKIITGLLDCYQPLLKLNRAEFEIVAEQKKEAGLLEGRLFKKLPSKHVRAYKHSVKTVNDEHEFYYRCRLLQDYISGMTDQFAFDEYRALMVIDAC